MDESVKAEYRTAESGAWDEYSAAPTQQQLDDEYESALASWRKPELYGLDAGELAA